MNDPGKMDRWVTIQTYTTSKDALGQSVKTWSTYTSAWAMMVYGSGKEGVDTEEYVATSRVKWSMRYRSGVTEKMRIVHNSETYYILQVAIIGRRDIMELITEKRDND